jgi:hypothetical protein
MATKFRNLTTEKFCEANKLLYSSIFGNKIIFVWFVLICIIFTLVTLLDVVLSLSFGGSTSHVHLLTRIIVVTLSILSLSVFRLLRNAHIIISFFLHFVICIGIIIFSTFIIGLFTELHPRAYFDAFLSMLFIYPLIIVGVVAVVIISHSINRRKTEKSRKIT